MGISTVRSSWMISGLVAFTGGCEVVRGGMTARVLAVDNFLSADDFGAGWGIDWEVLRGGMTARAVPVVFVSTFGFLSALVEVERTLAVRRWESSVNAPYLSLRVCNELVRVGLGEGIRVIEIGRGLARDSCTAG